MRMIGFTGTRTGLTDKQLIEVHMLLGDLQTAGASQATHGMCKGADAEFHEQAKGFGYFVIGCPGTHNGQPLDRAEMVCDLTDAERPMLIRNRTIVRESDALIAAPKETTEQGRGSGTWATIRYARQAQKPLCILWPDGSSTVEGVEGVTTAAAWRAAVTQ